MSKTSAATMPGPSANFGAERRTHERWKVFEIALFISSGASAPCVVDNMSEGGALVSADLVARPGEPATLEIEGFGAIPTRIVRRQDSMIALAFEFAPGELEPFREWLAAVDKEDLA